MAMDCQQRSCACVRLDTDKIRKDFPILDEPVRRGKKLVYFDNGATTQKPKVVIDRISDYYLHENANIHRGVHWLSEKSTIAYEMTRETVRNFLNAKESRELVYVRGTTEAINLVAHSFVQPRVGPDDEILITAMEHHSNIVPWQMVCKRTGAKLVVVPINEKGEISLTQVRKMITKKTKFVSVVHVSNALGTINPVEEIIKIAHKKDIPVLVDGAQSVAHMPIDLQAMDADFFAFSAHKMFGPTGVGILYGKATHLEAMEPYQSGGDMILTVTFEETTYNEIPYKFEAGTPNIAGVIGLGVAVEYLRKIGMDVIAAHEYDLTEYATMKLQLLDCVRIIGTAKEKAGVMSFMLKDVHPHDIAHELDLAGIAIRAGHHCAQPVMDFFGIPATARATFALYNTREEIDVLAEVLPKINKRFAR